MQKTLFWGILFSAFSAQAQVFMTHSGETRFFSKTPAEDIAALNNKVGAALNAATSDIAVTMFINQFAFPLSLIHI